MQNTLIYSSMMTQSLQNRVLLQKIENRQTDSQSTKCFGFSLQTIILAAGDTTTEILLYKYYCYFVVHYIRWSNQTAFSVIQSAQVI